METGLKLVILLDDWCMVISQPSHTNRGILHLLSGDAIHVIIISTKFSAQFPHAFRDPHEVWHSRPSSVKVKAGEGLVCLASMTCSRAQKIGAYQSEEFLAYVTSHMSKLSMEKMRLWRELSCYTPGKCWLLALIGLQVISSW